MKVTVLPALRGEWDLAIRADKYRESLLASYGSEDAAKRSRDEWSVQRSPLHSWEFFNRMAAATAFGDMTPSERQQMRVVVRFEQKYE